MGHLTFKSKNEPLKKKNADWRTSLLSVKKQTNKINDNKNEKWKNEKKYQLDYEFLISYQHAWSENEKIW